MKRATFAAIALLLAACSQPTPEPTATPTATPLPPTATLVPTDTPIPTDTHTATPRPTNTPRPTSTTRPTDIPSLTFTGTGDSIVDVETKGAARLIHIVGNATERHFAVQGYDSEGGRVNLLVNTTDAYDGYMPFDWLDDEITARLEVTATGEWTIEILPLAEIPIAKLPGVIEGNADAVYRFTDEPDIAAIASQTGGTHFAIFGWGSSGRDLLVNTTDPYAGSVVFERDTFAIQIIAEGEWIIGLTPRE